MQRSRSAVSLRLTSLLAILVPLVFWPATADAATGTAPPSCEIHCDGVNPNTAMYEDDRGVLRRCDARTIYTATLSSGGVVELRYSRHCRIAWARGSAHLLVKVEGYNSNGTVFRTSYEDWPSTGGGSSTHFTQAVNDAGLKARACGYTGGNVACTPKY